MNEVKKKCKYKSELSGWECPYEPLEDSKEGFCIFHERRKDKDIEKFNEGIKKIAPDKDTKAYHFEGFFFPTSIDFSGWKFAVSTYFNNAVFSGEYTNFRKAEFLGNFTSFTNTEFLGKTTNFDYAEFSGKKCTFVETKFRSEVTYFNVTKFSAKSTSFFQSEFSSQRTMFNFTRFPSGETEFFHIKCKNRIEFVGVTFQTKVIFEEIDLRKWLFLGIDLNNADFSLLSWNWKDKLLNELDVDWILEKEGLKKSELFFKTSEIYRQLKVQFHTKRDFNKAGIFHFREQECKRKAFKPFSRNFFSWVLLWILKLSCGYGEKPRNVLLTSISLIFLFAFSYMFLGLYNAKNELVFNYDVSFKNIAPILTILKDFGTSLAFSIKGFFPLWRFQQYKVVGDFANLIAGFEFLLGAFMVGLFIYVFRRRMDK